MQTVKVVRKDPGMDAIFWSGAEAEVEVVVNWVANRYGSATLRGGGDIPIGYNVITIAKQIKITTDNGVVYLYPGHWLIEYSSGEFEVCSEKRFVKHYDILES